MQMKTKRVLSILMCLCLILSTLAVSAVSVGAETSGDFEYEVLDDDTVEITGYIGEPTTLEIPAEIDGKSVTSIGDYAFSWCESLTSVTIPDSVKYIGECAFSDCTSLTSVTIPNSVTSIGYRAFGYIYDGEIGDYIKINGFIINGYTNSIAERYAKVNGFNFNSLGTVSPWKYDIYDEDDNTIEITKYTGSAEKVEIPGKIDDKKVVSIGNSAFSDCPSLTSVTIGNSVTSIGDRAFFYFTSLTSVTIGNSVTSIGDYAFYGCKSLKSVTIPDSVTSIGYKAFDDCESLTSVTIGNSVTSIGDDAFIGCKSLTSVTIPESVTYIGDYAFGYDDDYIKINGFIINGYTNSEAEIYANDNGIDFIDINNPHTHSYKSKTTKQPTCTKKGIKTYTCSCGKSYTETIPTKPHSYKWVVTKKASYVSNGIKSYKCSVCGKVSKTTSIAKLKLKTPSFSVSAGKKLFKVKYTKVTGATGFQVKYTIGKKTVTKTINTTKSVTKTISGLKKGSYKVQIRAFVKQGSKTAYSGWTKSKSVKVK